MNEWSRTRKRIILGLVLFVVVIIVGVPLYLLLYRAPTCSDGKLNGDETGVDCGGSCQLLCTTESLPLISRGDPRILNVAENVFEVVILVENPNVTAEISRARYTLKIYGSANVIPIKTIEGEAFVPKGSIFAVFEGPFNLEAGLVPVRAIIEWHDNTLIWQKNNVPMPELVIKNQILSREDTTPRINASVENLSFGDVSNIDLVALIYDENGNIFAASKTFINTLQAGEESEITLTWPRPFGSQVAEIEIIPRIFPDRSFLR